MQVREKDGQEGEERGRPPAMGEGMQRETDTGDSRPNIYFEQELLNSNMSRITYKIVWYSNLIKADIRNKSMIVIVPTQNYS